MRSAKNSPIPAEIIQEGVLRFQIDNITNKYLEFITLVMKSDGNLFKKI